MNELTLNLVRGMIKPRQADSHKGDHGHAFLVAGTKGRMGASVIAAKACLRAGCGLLTVNVPTDERAILQTTAPEAMLVMREEAPVLNKYSSIGIGPAIGTDKESIEMMRHLISNVSVPLILDADALTILSAEMSLFDSLPRGTIITPHPKEFDRLFGAHADAAARSETAIRKAKEKSIVIVLKGHRTVISNGDKAYQNTTGNAGLAKGGSGDALTGIITALLAQKYEPLGAACIGVFVHGLAADLALNDQSVESMLAGDVIENIGMAFKKITGAT